MKGKSNNISNQLFKPVRHSIHKPVLLDIHDEGDLDDVDSIDNKSRHHLKGPPCSTYSCQEHGEHYAPMLSSPLSDPLPPLPSSSPLPEASTKASVATDGLSTKGDTSGERDGVDEYGMMSLSRDWGGTRRKEGELLGPVDCGETGTNRIGRLKSPGNLPSSEGENAEGNRSRNPSTPRTGWEKQVQTGSLSASHVSRAC